jgi:hypothetical protein
MIRIRRIGSGTPLSRTYEVQFAPSEAAPPTETAKLRRGAAVRRLERDLGTADAWSFIKAADEAWDAHDTGWAVEYQSPGSANA